MPTTWTKSSGVATLWSGDDGFPPEIDGGAADTLAWVGLFDGGGAVALATTDLAVGVAPRLTAWITQGAP